MLNGSLEIIKNPIISIMYSQREQEARQRVLAEQQRLERESRFQKEEAERQERKKVQLRNRQLFS